MSERKPHFVVRFTAAKLKEFEQGYKAATTNGQRAFYMLSAHNMCAGRSPPGWLQDAISENLAAQLPPVPQNELAFVVGEKQLRAEYKAKGLSGPEAELEAAKRLGIYKPGKEDAVQIENLRRRRSRYRAKLRRKPGKRK